MYKKEKKSNRITMSSISVTGHSDLDCALETLYKSLYEQYQSQTQFTDLIPLMTNLRTLDQIGIHMVGAMIDIHAKKQQCQDETPFQGQKQSSNTAKFDIRQFDPILQHMLFEFSKRHLAKMSASLQPIQEISEEQI